ncbi:Putative E3 ubiquitin-protein ligase RING1a [Zea mays]|uniref:Putative E3 ubiquitin-protein ligase RING1a n=1 Tax=Zea mays TaxID=4577 RepID=A0A1D6N9I9_MAIZE|nr:Putative E3 ubiquitin-protein ligase RING1a [Zea mays]
MPAQKRRLPSPSSKPRDDVAATASDAAAGGGVGEGRGGRPPLPSRDAAKRWLTDPEPQQGFEDDSDAEDDGGADGDSEFSQSDGGGNDGFMLVKLAEIRKEVQCPICLGIIRKTRTVMECLHRFCRDCIDKSMRLGNNECPSCRTHCASRRSLRDDPNYDALIAALYPDIDKYEEEELAFNEQEMTRNQKFQLYLVLLPVDGQTIPHLEKPYLSCQPTLSIQHLVELIALQLSRKVEELEMYIRMDGDHGSVGSMACSIGEFDGLERLREDKLLSELHPSFASSNGDLELRYALKTRD